MVNSKIFFEKEEIQEIIQFADKIKWKHPSFKGSKEKVRGEDEVFLSILRGKLAEVALRKYLLEKHKGKSCQISSLDYDVYRRGICDDFDLKFNDYTISIKSSKPFATCLLIETAKYKLNQSGEPIGIDGKLNNIPDFYTFVKVDINYNDLSKSYAQICGAISHKEFWKKKKMIPRGTRISKSNMYKLFKLNKPLTELNVDQGFPLMTSNYALHIDMLKSF